MDAGQIIASMFQRPPRAAERLSVVQLHGTVLLRRSHLASRQTQQTDTVLSDRAGATP